MGPLKDQLVTLAICAMIAFALYGIASLPAVIIGFVVLIAIGEAVLVAANLWHGKRKWWVTSNHDPSDF